MPRVGAPHASSKGLFLWLRLNPALFLISWRTWWRLERVNGMYATRQPLLIARAPGRRYPTPSWRRDTYSSSRMWRSVELNLGPWPWHEAALRRAQLYHCPFLIALAQSPDAPADESSSDGPEVVEGFDESQRGVTKAAGDGVSPGSPLPRPQMLSAAQVFLLRSMAEITSSLKSAADTLNGQGPWRDKVIPLHRTIEMSLKMKRLDGVLSDGRYVPFADYGVETLRGSIRCA